LAHEKSSKPALIGPSAARARLPWTTQNWQHWKDVR
jgi:hypothetical protein